MSGESLHTDVLLLRSGDKNAFERLYKMFWAKVYHFTSLYIKDEYEREEIVQQVFIKLWEIRERLLPEHGLDGLLFIITRNIVFKQSHRSADIAAIREGQELDCASEDDVEAALEANELEKYIYSLIDTLPARQREAFLMSRENGLSYQDIARMMGISEKGVARHIHLALLFLRKNLPLFLIFLAS